jgi:hypothetical protein
MPLFTLVGSRAILVLCCGVMPLFTLVGSRAILVLCCGVMLLFTLVGSRVILVLCCGVMPLFTLVGSRVILVLCCGVMLLFTLVGSRVILVLCCGVNAPVYFSWKQGYPCSMSTFLHFVFTFQFFYANLRRPLMLPLNYIKMFLFWETLIINYNVVLHGMYFPGI